MNLFSKATFNDVEFCNYIEFRPKAQLDSSLSTQQLLLNITTLNRLTSNSRSGFDTELANCQFFFGKFILVALESQNFNE